MEIWFYALNGSQQGPVSIETVSQLLQSGQLPPDSLIWKEGMANWLPAHSVPELVNPGLPGAVPVSQSGRPQPEYALQYQSASGVVFAGFWLRFAAAIVDGLIIYLPFKIVGAVLQYLVAQSSSNSSAKAGIAVLGCGISLIQLVAGWLYFAKMESSPKMATIGKSVCGIKVTDMQGAPISFGTASGRYFGKIVSAIILYVGFMMAGWTQKKQALHDIMASTLVVKK